MNFFRRLSKLLMKKVILLFFRACPRTSFFLISKCGGKSMMRDIMRGWLIRQQIEKFTKILELVKYPNQLLIDRAGCFATTDEIFVNTTHVDRYFMYEGNVPYHGEARRLFEKLQRYPIKLEQFVDLGANSGDFSIWFAKHTNARILAVEPSTENLRGGALAFADPGSARIVMRIGYATGPGSRISKCGHARIPVRRNTRRVLLHRNEHAYSGRASGDRSHNRH